MPRSGWYFKNFNDYGPACNFCIDVVRGAAGAGAQFAGLTSCCYTHYASNMHYNIAFPDKKDED